MENKRNRLSMAAFICSIVPIVVTAILVALVALAFQSVPTGDGEAEGMGAFFAAIFAGFFIVIVTIPLGIISVVLGIIAIRRREPRGKKLAKVAIVLGILEIVPATVIGCVFWIVPKL